VPDGDKWRVIRDFNSGSKLSHDNFHVHPVSVRDVTSEGNGTSVQQPQHQQSVSEDFLPEGLRHQTACAVQTYVVVISLLCLVLISSSFFSPKAGVGNLWHECQAWHAERYSLAR
jgi:hypothetical protein